MDDKEKSALKKRLQTMIERCFNPNDKAYKWYGAKGIKVCKEWVEDRNSFIEWAVQNGYKKGLTVERFDNNKGYCPSNCCFVPMSEQPKNTSRNVYLDYHGEILYMSEVARRENVSPEAIRKRVKRGCYRVVENPNRLRSNPTPLA